MRFLFCAGLHYYDLQGAYDPLYHFFHDTLVEMGHEVDCVDTAEHGRRSEGRDAFNERVLGLVRARGYAAVIVATFADEFHPATLDEMRRHTVVVAWNSDDDRRWDDYSSRYAPHFSLVYTTYPPVYEEHRAAFPNLRLSQWACLPRFRGLDHDKDIAFSFCGQAYGERLLQLYRLRRSAGLRFYGKGTRVVTGLYWPDRVTRAAARRLERWTGLRILGDAFLSYEQMHDVWCRSRLVLNLQRASVGGRLQIKSRTFETGLSGAAMLSEHAPLLERYYEPGVEFIPFTGVEDCVDKARFYLSHEPERRRIAEAYARRTEAEHLWTHRLAQVLRDAGLGGA